jgi:hypothetical protein
MKGSYSMLDNSSVKKQLEQAVTDNMIMFDDTNSIVLFKEFTESESYYNLSKIVKNKYGLISVYQVDYSKITELTDLRNVFLSGQMLKALK